MTGDGTTHGGTASAPSPQISDRPQAGGPRRIRLHPLAIYPLLCAAVLLRLRLTGEYKNYVRASMGRWILLAGLFFAASFLWCLVAGGRGAPHDPEHAGGHDHEHPHTHRSRTAWLLALPIAVLVLASPGPLGTYAVDRRAQTSAATSIEYPDLPAASGPITMGMREFDSRAFDRDGSTLRGRQVTLVGFLSSRRSPAGDPVLVRFTIFCCAADAITYVASLTGWTGPEPAAGEWVRATGTFAGVTDKLPQLKVADLASIPTPADPYE